MVLQATFYFIMLYYGIWTLGGDTGGGLGAWTSSNSPNCNRNEPICMWQHRFGHLGQEIRGGPSNTF